jgi:hypothetical protein
VAKGFSETWYLYFSLNGVTPTKIISTAIRASTLKEEVGLRKSLVSLLRAHSLRVPVHVETWEQTAYRSDDIPTRVKEVKVPGYSIL